MALGTSLGQPENLTQVHPSAAAPVVRREQRYGALGGARASMKYVREIVGFIAPLLLCTNQLMFYSLFLC